LVGVSHVPGGIGVAQLREAVVYAQSSGFVIDVEPSGTSISFVEASLL
jgi:hypothetical protein